MMKYSLGECVKQKKKERKDKVRLTRWKVQALATFIYFVHKFGL